MEALYFPKELYVEAHEQFLAETGIDPQYVYEYCLDHIEFFVEVVFSYIEGSDWPFMEDF